MRICSLLPGITDTVIALGAVDSLVGVTHACDIPDSCSAQVVTGSRITYGQGSAGIDRQVRHASSSLFDLDTELLEQLHPDLILTQTLCSVCAVDENLVREVADDFSWQVEIRSFQPTTVASLIEMIQEIGVVVRQQEKTRQWLHQLQGLLDSMSDHNKNRRKIKTLFLEWMSPPFTSGHWIPELIEMAGGIEMLGRTGHASVGTSWGDVRAQQAEVIVLAPCGYTINQSLEESVIIQRELSSVRHLEMQGVRIFLADGNRFFNRPGTNLTGALKILHHSIQGEKLDWNYADYVKELTNNISGR